jgi:hypothetical protein
MAYNMLMSAAVTLSVYQMEFVKQYFIIKINEKLNSFLYSHQLDFLLKYDALSCGKLNFQQLFMFFISGTFQSEFSSMASKARHQRDSNRMLR